MQGLGRTPPRDRPRRAPAAGEVAPMDERECGDEGARFCSSAQPSPHSAPLRCSFAPPCYGAPGAYPCAIGLTRMRQQGLPAHPCCPPASSQRAKEATRIPAHPCCPQLRARGPRKLSEPPLSPSFEPEGQGSYANPRCPPASSQTTTGPRSTKVHQSPPTQPPTQPQLSPDSAPDP